MSIGFRDLHPIKVKPFTGKDLPPTDGCARSNESRFVRCRFCGSINDTELRVKGDGWGGNVRCDSITGTNAKDPVVTAGCWFCGSSTGW